jgi:hypothetical protein
MAAIKVLNLAWNWVDLPSVNSLAGSPHLAGLEVLSLRRGSTGFQKDGDAVAAAVARSPHLARLAALSLLSTWKTAGSATRPYKRYPARRSPSSPPWTWAAMKSFPRGSKPWRPLPT